MAGKSALPLLMLAGGAALLMKKKKKSTKKSTSDDSQERLPKPPEPEPSPEPSPEPTPQPSPSPSPEPTPPGPVPEPQPKPEREKARELKPGTYDNVSSYARYGVLLPYRTPDTTISIRRKSGLVWYPAKQEEARFVGWNPQLYEEANIDIDTKGEYSIIALDGGPNGVFIAEWTLKATQE